MAVAVMAALGLVRLGVAIVFAVLALYAGFFAFSWLTGGFDASGEIRRGNVAAGILMAAIFLGISVPLNADITGILSGLSTLPEGGAALPAGATLVGALAFGLLLSIILAIGALYLVMAILARASPGTDALREIKYGNTAVALMMGGMILAVCTLVHFGVEGIVRALL